MIFPEAARHYGMYYMEQRFPHIDEADLKEVLSRVLEILDDLIKSLFPPVPSSLQRRGFENKFAALTSK